jgi:hypothetical protein
MEEKKEWKRTLPVIQEKIQCDSDKGFLWKKNVKVARFWEFFSSEISKNIAGFLKFSTFLFEV